MDRLCLNCNTVMYADYHDDIAICTLPAILKKIFFKIRSEQKGKNRIYYLGLFLFFLSLFQVLATSLLKPGTSFSPCGVRSSGR